MGYAQERRARGTAQRDRCKKLIDRAEWEFGPLERGDSGDDVEETKSKLLESFRRQNAGERREQPVRRQGKPPALLAENVRAWNVLMTAYTGRQFLIAPMGGVVGFLYDAVLRHVELTVPEDRRTEVFEKFRWVEQYALQTVMVKREGAGGGKNTHTAAAAQRRRNRRRS